MTDMQSEVAFIGVFVVIVGAALTMFFFLRERRSARLRGKFGTAEYARAVNESGNRRHAEARLEARSKRVERSWR